MNFEALCTMHADGGEETAASTACAGLPVEADLSYWAAPIVKQETTAVEYGFCPAIRACSSSFDLLVGISQCASTSNVVKK